LTAREVDLARGRFGEESPEGALVQLEARLLAELAACHVERQFARVVSLTAEWFEALAIFHTEEYFRLTAMAAAQRECAG
jgi:hypothetical protein